MTKSFSITMYLIYLLKNILLKFEILIGYREGANKKKLHFYRWHVKKLKLDFRGGGENHPVH